MNDVTIRAVFRVAVLHLGVCRWKWIWIQAKASWSEDRTRIFTTTSAQNGKSADIYEVKCYFCVDRLLTMHLPTLAYTKRFHSAGFYSVGQGTDFCFCTFSAAIEFLLNRLTLR